MGTNKITKKKQQNFWTFFHQYRTKIALLTFFVILPITLLLIAYLGPLEQSRSVTFDTDNNNQSIFISDFNHLEDLKDIDITLDWTTLRNPVFDEDILVTSGLYRFIVSYDVLNNKNISNLRVQIALKPLYGTDQDMSTLTSIRSTSQGSSVDVIHNVMYPFSPLWFINIEEPNVYLKIIYTESFEGNIDPIEVTVYAYYSLKDKLPISVE